MKKIKLIELLIPVVIATSCINVDETQTGVKTETIIEKNMQTPVAQISLLNNNTLYVGVDNPVSITVPGNDTISLNVNITVGTITKVTNREEYIIRIDKLPSNNKKGKVTIKGIANGIEETIGEFDFNIKHLPNPIAEIAGQTDGKINKEKLLEAGAIEPYNQYNEFGLTYQITGYTFVTIINGDWIPQKVYGGKFPYTVERVIINGKRKQQLFFLHIQAKGPGGIIRNLNPIHFEIN